MRDLPPRYQELRKRLLTLARDLGNLPEEELKKLECPEAKYLVGWSKGKEKLANDKPDTLKGSYYVNCKEAPADVVEKYKDLPEYTHANIWPSEDVLSGFKETFQEMVSFFPFFFFSSGFTGAGSERVGGRGRYEELNVNEQSANYFLS